MKFNRRFAAFAAAVAASAVLISGCHQPEFEQLKPTKVKWALSVIAVSPGDAQKTAIQGMVSQLAATQAMATNVTWLEKPADAAAALDKAAASPGVDLILLGNASDNLQAVAQKHPEKRFAVLGDENVPHLSNVRSLTAVHKNVLFLAGFLAAEANKESSAPFSVYVDKTRPSSDPDWQTVLAGVRFAGRKDAPIQVSKDAILPPPPSNTGKAASNVTNQKATLSGRSLLLLDEMPDDVWAKIRDRGMKCIRTDQSTKGLAYQSNCVAQPATLLQEAVGEESQLLQAGKWAAGQSVELQAKQVFNLTQPELFLDKDLATRLDLIQEQLASGALKPETW
ncbi:hypothetical protein [Tumebacillus flagellatus]|uniref:ABC transporter substrate-binding protein PnrA-like domain-containing protein n=1 Tax=Tumebacillus flagellatus TaxID=1157490 RepID=A0A074LVY2_9BACL|nr:hypothetical protein [Tumebacillus flagellatus]KEO84193.1 hypothetical protein EL26_05350 [Tumebacillus flagellatus]